MELPQSLLRTPIAVIGAGLIGKTHIEHLAANSDFRLAAIVDPSEASLAIAKRFGVPHFADHRVMLDEAKPAGVVVATPNATHVSVASDCLNRGVAALIEKPLADSVVEARALVNLQQKTGVPVLVGHHRRYNPINQRAKALIAQGRLGKVVTATAMALMYKPEPYFDVAWRKEPGGGPVLINLIHDIDMLRFLLGEVVEVQALGGNQVRGFAVEDSAACVLRFASGAIASVTVSDTAVSPWCWDFCAGEQGQYPRQPVQSHFISGTHGSLSLPDLSFWSYKGERHWYDELTREQSVVHVHDVYTRQIQHFRAVIEGKEAPICSALDGLRTLEATKAVSLALQTQLGINPETIE